MTPGLIPRAQKLDFVNKIAKGQLPKMRLTLIKFSEPEV